MLRETANWKITQEMIEREIEKARAAKEEHAGKRKKERRVIGSFFGGGERSHCLRISCHCGTTGYDQASGANSREFRQLLYLTP